MNQTTKGILGGVVALLLLAGGLYARSRANAKADDEAIVAYVYDVLLPRVLPTLAECNVQASAGVAVVTTSANTVTITGWRHDPHSVLSPSQRTCIEAHLTGASGQPPGVQVETGHEYEVDVSFDLPQSGLQ